MATEKEKDVEWGKRLLLLREGRNLSQKELVAEGIGLSLPTIQRYEAGQLPSVKSINRIASFFKCSKPWLHTGEGVPFPDRPEEAPGGVRENTAGYDPALATADALFSSNQKINIDEAQGKAYRVLSAGNALSVALYMNIQQFAAALDAGQELKICQEQMKGLQTQIDALKKQVDGLTATPSTAAAQDDGSEKEVM